MNYIHKYINVIEKPKYEIFCLQESWPGITQLPDYSKITFPDTAGVSYLEMVPEVG